MNRDKFYLQMYYGTLCGYTITKVHVVEEEDGELFPTFVAKRKGHPDLHLTLSRDEEGNGRGFLFGLPIKEMEV